MVGNLKTINNFNAFAWRESQIPSEIRKAFNNFKDFNNFNICHLLTKNFNTPTTGRQAMLSLPNLPVVSLSKRPKFV